MIPSLKPKEPREVMRRENERIPSIYRPASRDRWSRDIPARGDGITHKIKESRMNYSERHKHLKNTIIISCPMRWGGSFHDRRFWMSEFNGCVEDYGTKKQLINDAIKRGLPFVVLRVHRNGDVSILETGWAGIAKRIKTRKDDTP
jgi:hypothetical protein